MPDYLAQPQVVIGTLYGDQNLAESRVASFDPDTGDELWNICNGNADALSNMSAPVFKLQKEADDPRVFLDSEAGGFGFAIAPNRKRIWIVQRFYMLHIYDENLTFLDMVNVREVLRLATGIPSDAGNYGFGYLDTRGCAARPNGNLVLMVEFGEEEVSPFRTYWHFLELGPDGAFVALHKTQSPTRSSAYFDELLDTWGMLQLDVSNDDRLVGFVGPILRNGQPWDGAGSPSSPPMMDVGDPDNLFGPWGRFVYQYDLVNDVEYPQPWEHRVHPLLDANETNTTPVMVDADPIKYGFRYDAAKQVLTGSAGLPLSCSPSAGHCSLANSVFGPGFLTRETQGGIRRSLYRDDPDCVWFDQTGDFISRSTAGWLNNLINWKRVFRFVPGIAPTGSDYQTMLFVGDYADESVWFGTFIAASGLYAGQWVFELEVTAGGLQTSARSLVTPYTDYEITLEYQQPLGRLVYSLNGAVADTLSVTLSVVADVEALGSDGDAASVPGFGVSRYRIYQGQSNTLLVANAPLVAVTNPLTDTKGHTWTRNGSLATDAYAVDRYGTERGAVGTNINKTTLWFCKYIRQFGNSAIMAVERNIRTGLRTRMFRMPIFDWLDGSGYARFGYINNIVALVEDAPITDEDVTGEEEFVAGGTTGVLTWIEHTRKSD